MEQAFDLLNNMIAKSVTQSYQLLIEPTEMMYTHR